MPRAPVSFFPCRACEHPERCTIKHKCQPERPVVPFVVKHYAGDERPIIKGNGFDGLEIGNDREEAQAFIDWINKKLC